MATVELPETAQDIDPFFYVEPSRVMDLSDVNGDELDIFSRLDFQAILTKLIRSRVDEFRREYDVFGRESAVAYIVAEVARLLEEVAHSPSLTEEKANRFFGKKTLILGNAAPRVGEEGNGQEFLVAKVGDLNLQVIGSPSVFSKVKDKIHPSNLYRCPNEAGYYFPEGEQYRSSYMELLATDPSHLVSADLSGIPDPPNYNRVEYVDRFGNITLGTPDNDEFQRDLYEASVQSNNGDGENGRLVGLVCNGIKLDTFVLGKESLGHAPKGRIIQYRNATRGGVHNLVYGWTKGMTAREKLDLSPYAQFGRPEEGSVIEIR